MRTRGLWVTGSEGNSRRQPASGGGRSQLPSGSSSRRRRPARRCGHPGGGRCPRPRLRGDERTGFSVSRDRGSRGLCPPGAPWARDAESVCGAIRAGWRGVALRASRRHAHSHQPAPEVTPVRPALSRGLLGTHPPAAAAAGGLRPAGYRVLSARSPHSGSQPSLFPPNPAPCHARWVPPSGLGAAGPPMAGNAPAAAHGPARHRVAWTARDRYAWIHTAGWRACPSRGPQWGPPYLVLRSPHPPAPTFLLGSERDVPGLVRPPRERRATAIWDRERSQGLPTPRDMDTRIRVLCDVHTPRPFDHVSSRIHSRTDMTATGLVGHRPPAAPGLGWLTPLTCRHSPICVPNYRAPLHLAAWGNGKNLQSYQS